MKKTIISILTICAFISQMLVGSMPGYAQGAYALPAVGTLVIPTQAYVPVLLRGIRLDPQSAMDFDFIVDSGDNLWSAEQVAQESKKLINYFFTAMTVPEKDLWVNLSPYERDRIISSNLGQTELGRELLAQDYILKQLTASFMFPDSEIGRKFWQKIKERVSAKYGDVEWPANTFNKVWIVPDKVVIFEEHRSVYIVEASLKVMLEEDYLATNNASITIGENIPKNMTDSSFLVKEIIREIILPEIEKEINQGAQFAPLRQLYHSLILAKWYKETLKDNLLTQEYVDQNKVLGLTTSDQEFKENIYRQYLQSFQVGAVNLVREEYDAASQAVIPRKYFSGGIIPLDNLSLDPFTGREVPPTAGAPFSVRVRAKDYSLLAQTVDLRHSQNISTLNLGKSIEGALRKAGIHVVSQLRERTGDQLKEINGIADQSAEKIRAQLAGSTVLVDEPTEMLINAQAFLDQNEQPTRFVVSAPQTVTQLQELESYGFSTVNGPTQEQINARIVQLYLSGEISQVKAPLEENGKFKKPHYEIELVFNKPVDFFGHQITSLHLFSQESVSLRKLLTSRAQNFLFNPSHLSDAVQLNNNFSGTPPQQKQAAVQLIQASVPLANFRPVGLFTLGLSSDETRDQLIDQLISDEAIRQKYRERIVPEQRFNQLLAEEKQAQAQHQAKLREKAQAQLEQVFVRLTDQNFVVPEVILKVYERILEGTTIKDFDSIPKNERRSRIEQALKKLIAEDPNNKSLRVVYAKLFPKGELVQPMTEVFDQFLASLENFSLIAQESVFESPEATAIFLSTQAFFSLLSSSQQEHNRYVLNIFEMLLKELFPDIHKILEKYAQKTEGELGIMRVLLFPTQLNQFEMSRLNEFFKWMQEEYSKPTGNLMILRQLSPEIVKLIYSTFQPGDYDKPVIPLLLNKFIFKGSRQFAREKFGKLYPKMVKLYMDEHGDSPESKAYWAKVSEIMTHSQHTVDAWASHMPNVYFKKLEDKGSFVLWNFSVLGITKEQVLKASTTARLSKGVSEGERDNALGIMMFRATQNPDDLEALFFKERIELGGAYRDTDGNLRFFGREEAEDFAVKNETIVIVGDWKYQLKGNNELLVLDQNSKPLRVINNPVLYEYCIDVLRPLLDNMIRSVLIKRKTDFNFKTVNTIEINDHSVNISTVKIDRTTHMVVGQRKSPLLSQSFEPMAPTPVDQVIQRMVRIGHAMGQVYLQAGSRPIEKVLQFEDVMNQGFITLSEKLSKHGTFIDSQVGQQKFTGYWGISIPNFPIEHLQQFISQLPVVDVQTQPEILKETVTVFPDQTGAQRQMDLKAVEQYVIEHKAVIKLGRFVYRLSQDSVEILAPENNVVTQVTNDPTLREYILLKFHAVLSALVTVDNQDSEKKKRIISFFGSGKEDGIDYFMNKKGKTKGAFINSLNLSISESGEFYGKFEDTVPPALIKQAKVYAQVGWAILNAADEGKPVIGVLPFEEAISQLPVQLKDAAMQANERLGGIDFIDLPLDRKGAGLDVDFSFDQSLPSKSIMGISPLIIEVAPIQSIKSFLLN